MTTTVTYRAEEVHRMLAMVKSAKGVPATFRLSLYNGLIYPQQLIRQYMPPSSLVRLLRFISQVSFAHPAPQHV